MENQNVHDHSCTHCACRNPLLEALKEELFSAENYAALPAGRANDKEPQSLTLMVKGGTIRPMISGSLEVMPAIGFADGQVAITGSEKEVKEFMEREHPGFKIKTLENGHTLLPGLIEPHVHIVPTSLLMGWLDLGPFDGQDLSKHYDESTVNKAIKKAAATLKGADWLLGNGLDPSLMPLQDNNTQLVTIDLQWLDNMTSTVPVLILSASMHTLYVNTPALTAVFNNNVNNPKFNHKKYPTLAKYLKDTNGQLQDADMYPAFSTIPKSQIKDMFVGCFAHFKTIFQTANERGVTFMYDAGMNKQLKELLEAYLIGHQRKVRIGAAQICGSKTDAENLPAHDPKKDYRDIYIGNVKVVSDGSNQGLTGYQSKEYLCNPEHNFGLFNYGKTAKPTTPPSEYSEMVKIIIEEKGWPLMIHANGDLAVKFAIEVYQKHIPHQKEQGVRHRIEHCSLITQEELDTMCSLGISPSFLIGHVGYWGYAFNKVIFGEKSMTLDLCNSALKKGMRISMHSDNSVSPLGPLRMMEQSITRIMEADPKEEVLNPDECITAEQALIAMTYDAAWQCNADQWTGSLETGKFADFVILKEDPIALKKPYKKMRDIGVLETWVGGVPVYKK